MDIYISWNNREEIIRLPVMPETIEISKPHKNETFETISMGEIKLIGKAGLKSISFQSFFPIRDYPFVKDKSYTADGYIYQLDLWRQKRTPIRLTITETPINMACVIDDFSYNIGMDGNRNYSITFGEFKLISIN